MIDKTNCAAVLVDYRLAPEHPYPTPLDDCWDGLVWSGQEAERLKVPLVVAGDSAGGNLRRSARHWHATAADRRLRCRY
jgi:acetyl esterase